MSSRLLSFLVAESPDLLAGISARPLDPREAPRLFRLLDPDERTAIVAHELAHLENYDAFVQTLAYSVLRTLVGLVMDERIERLRRRAGGSARHVPVR